MFTSQFRTKQLLLALGTLSLVLAVYFCRVPLATWWWQNTHTLPEVVIFVSQDVWLGVEAADYYFDNNDNKQETYDVDRAEKLYEQILNIDPTVAWVWYQKGRIAFLHKEYNKALEYLEKHQDLSDIIRPRAIYLKGVVLGFAGQPEAALQSLQEFYEITDESWYIHNNLAWIHFQLGDFQAMDDISVAGLKLQPDNPWLLMNRSLALYNMGQNEKAQEYIARSYAQAIQLTEADWSKTYPGNDPLIAQMGLDELLSIIEANKNLINKAE